MPHLPHRTLRLWHIEYYAGHVMVKYVVITMCYDSANDSVQYYVECGLTNLDDQSKMIYRFSACSHTKNPYNICYQYCNDCESWQPEHTPTLCDPTHKSVETNSPCVHIYSLSENPHNCGESHAKFLYTCIIHTSAAFISQVFHILGII